MNKEELKKFAEEEFINNTMKHLDSALIFTYIQNLEKENQQLKKQKDDVVKYIKKHFQDDEGIIYKVIGNSVANRNEIFIEDLLRMLGEIDVED